MTCPKFNVISVRNSDIPSKIIQKGKKILASLVETKKEEDLLIYSTLSSEMKSNKNIWIIENGASYHVTSFKDKFEMF